MAMIIRRVFISYNEADRKYANKIRLWAKRGLCCNSNQRVMTLVEREKTRHYVSKTQQAPPSVGMKIIMSDFIIVLIGNENQEHPWIAREPISAQKGIVRYYMRIPYTNGDLPETLANLKQLAYNPNSLEFIFRDLPEKPAITFPKKFPPKKDGYKGQNSGVRRKRTNEQENQQNSNQNRNPRQNNNEQRSYQQRSDRPYGGGYKPYHQDRKPNTGYIKRETSPPPPPPPPTEPPLIIRDNDIGLEW